MPQKLLKAVLTILFLVATEPSYAIIDGESVEKRLLQLEKSTIAIQMKYITPDGNVSFRKGTAFILNENTLVTAGHNAFYIDLPENIEAIFSTKPCWGENHCNEKRIRISEKIVHPKFQNDYPNPPVYDIAILKLSQKIPRGFVPLKLFDPNSISSASVFFLGYGNSVAKPDLDDFRLRKIEWQVDSLLFGGDQKFVFPQSKGGFCAGDSGGALIFKGVEGNVALGIAIHHSLDESSEQKGCEGAGVYTDLKFFSSWIRSVLGDEV